MSLKLKYFVLNPGGSDKAYAAASRAAMIEFARHIYASDPKLSAELRGWVDTAIAERRAKI